MIRELERFPYEGRLTDLGLLEKRRLWRDFIAAFQCLKRTYKKDGDRLFIRASCDRTRGNGFKLKKSRSRLGIGKNFFTIRVVKQWNRLPRDVIDAPSLKTSQSPVGWGFEQFDLLEDVPAHCTGFGLGDL